MNERQSDIEWLQQFARAGNQSAFRELVRRHIDLVFATAMRKVGDAGGAEEISQNVFGALAKKAWQFAPDDSLAAWLHKTTLLESQAWQRGEMRRRRREQTAAELGTTMKTPDEQPAFRALIPLLDEALLSLREKDREALLLRYYESQSLKDVGAALGVSDDTAQKRVQTALEKLSQFFQRRGFKTATVAATTAALQHTVASATSATVAVVFNAAIQTAPPALVGIGALLARFAGLTKLQTAAICVVIAAGPVAWKWEQARKTAREIEASQSNLNALRVEHGQASYVIERLLSESAQLEQMRIDAIPDQTREAQVQQKWSDLKAHSRALLAADNYRWPDDLPFVRVPKSALAAIKAGAGPNTPEKLEAKVNQFLDLSPQEREVTGQAFSNYFGGIERLLETNLFETNQSLRLSLPPGAESKVFVLLPLGEKIRAALDQLCADLETTLGSDRWAMVKPEQFEFKHYEQIRLLGYTQYDWDQTQEIVINFFASAGDEPLMSWATTGGAGSSPMPLRLFLTGGSAKTSPRLPTLTSPQGPPILIERVQNWLAAEAALRLAIPVTK
jgi:RNA polymerase sigma factor (sigma-70 family)